MSRRRFFAPRSSFHASQVFLSAEESRHLRDVLRLRAGDEVYVFDGEGQEYLCRVGERAAGRARGETALEVCERVEALSPESPLDLSLLVGLLKGEKFDLVVQKATELGVRRIVPVVTKRADVRILDARDAEKRVARWRRLALEAAKQSGRARVPVVEMPFEFAALSGGEAVSEASSFAGEAELDGAQPRATVRRLLFAERGGESLEAILSAWGGGAHPVRLEAMTGSEGGWESAEIDAARRAGWQIVTLGGRTLRAETAALAVAALLQHRFGDLV